MQGIAIRGAEMIRRMLMPIVAAAALTTSAPVLATVYLFNFNNATLSSVITTSGVTTDGLGGAAGTAAINAYLNSILPGTTESGGIATSGYTADGNAILTVTLGNSDGATGYGSPTHGPTSPPDDFLVNNNFPVLKAPASNSIVIVIPAGVPIDSISFDYAIFPDNNCTSSTCANNTGNANFPTLQVTIGTVVEPILYADTRTFLDTNVSNSNWDPQIIGTISYGSLGITGSTPTTITFTDWPPEIGIDNLTVYTCRSTDRGCVLRTVPEPSPLPLAGLALALLAALRWKARRGDGPLWNRSDA